ncbi:MAG TPA: hypothetical protein DCX06_14320 [Opitutae bacterium]|nr:hypothetical protein [Opitutae bacterium]
MSSYCIFTETICHGIVPTWRDEHGNWVIYQSKAEALREIIDDFLEHQRQFFEGERSFEEAMFVEDTIRKVKLLPDGSIEDEFGQVFPPDC